MIKKKNGSISEAEKQLFLDAMQGVKKLTYQKIAPVVKQPAAIIKSQQEPSPYNCFIRS